MASEAALTVSVEPPPAASEVAESAAVTPGSAGFTLALRLTVPALPTCEVLMVLVAPLPCTMESDDGLAPMVKSAGGGALTVPLTRPASAGLTLALNATLPALPICVVLTALVPLFPCSSVSVPGEALMPKSGGAFGQPGSLKLLMRVFQLKLPFAFKYSSVYQKVQSSTGSTDMVL